MSKPKYEKPVLSSIGLPIKRAQGFDILGYCGQGNLAGGTGASCDGGIELSGTIPDSCGGGDYATNSCGGGGHVDWHVDDGCGDGYTIYDGAACDTGINESTDEG